MAFLPKLPDGRAATGLFPTLARFLFRNGEFMTGEKVNANGISVDDRNFYVQGRFT
jgi:hypothetical protein